MFEGYRNRKALNKDKFVEVVQRVGAFVHIAPEIAELDLIPLMATEKDMKVVDVRIQIENTY